MDFPGGAGGKEPTCQQRRCRRCRFDPLGQEDRLEEGMATHSRIVAWRILMDRGAWRAAVYGVARVIHDIATKQQQSCMLYTFKNIYL